MMNETAITLATKLRLRFGRDVVGVGPDSAQLGALWSDQQPGALRPAVDTLEQAGLIRVERAIATRHAGIADDLGLHDIAGISITENLQEYCDKLGI
jgi:hypothetical protein